MAATLRSRAAIHSPVTASNIDANYGRFLFTDEKITPHALLVSDFNAVQVAAHFLHTNLHAYAIS